MPQVIPARQLTTESSPPVLVVDTPFPPDDRSSDYERGNFVSREWDEATTYAALETADKVVAMLPSLLRSGNDAERRRSRETSRRGGDSEPTDTAEESEQRNARIKAFAGEFVERAFRRPLTEEQRSVYIDRQFELSRDPDDAIRRIVVNASGNYLTRTGDSVTFTGARELSEFLAENEETHRAFARQLFHFMVQQLILAFGPDTIAELGDFFSQHDYELRALMVEIACCSARLPTGH